MLRSVQAWRASLVSCGTVTSSHALRRALLLADAGGFPVLWASSQAWCLCCQSWTEPRLPTLLRTHPAVRARASVPSHLPWRRRSRDDAAAVHWPPPLALPEWLEDDGDGSAPEFFRCPITLCVMREPTQTPAGRAPG